jgi:hypothetical protein
MGDIQLLKTLLRITIDLARYIIEVLPPDANTTAPTQPQPQMSTTYSNEYIIEQFNKPVLCLLADEYYSNFKSVEYDPIIPVKASQLATSPPMTSPIQQETASIHHDEERASTSTVLTTAASGSAKKYLWPNAAMDKRLLRLYIHFFACIDPSQDVTLGGEAGNEEKALMKLWLQKDKLEYDISVFYVLMLRFQCSLRGLSFSTIYHNASFNMLWNMPWLTEADELTTSEPHLWLHVPWNQVYF